MLKAAASILFAACLLLAAAVHAQASFTEGEVRKVHRDNRKVTIKHGEIRNIDMPPMTMEFAVKDARMLEMLQPGDKVRFRAANEGGKFTVTEMEPAR